MLAFAASIKSLCGSLTTILEQSGDDWSKALLVTQCICFLFLLAHWLISFVWQKYCKCSISNSTSSTNRISNSSNVAIDNRNTSSSSSIDNSSYFRHLLSMFPSLTEDNFEQWCLVVLCGIFRALSLILILISMTYMQRNYDFILIEVCTICLISILINCILFKSQGERMTSFVIIPFCLIIIGAIFVCQPSFIFGYDGSGRGSGSVIDEESPAVPVVPMPEEEEEDSHSHSKLQEFETVDNVETFSLFGLVFAVLSGIAHLVFCGLIKHLQKGGGGGGINNNNNNNNNTSINNSNNNNINKDEEDNISLQLSLVITMICIIFGAILFIFKAIYLGVLLEELTHLWWNIISLHIGMGFLLYIFLLTIILSYKNGNFSSLGLIWSITIIMRFIFDTLMFKIIDNWLEFVGCFVILIGCIIIFWQEWNVVEKEKILNMRYMRYNRYGGGIGNDNGGNGGDHYYSDVNDPFSNIRRMGNYVYTSLSHDCDTSSASYGHQLDCQNVSKDNYIQFKSTFQNITIYN